MPEEELMPGWDADDLEMTATGCVVEPGAFVSLADFVIPEMTSLVAAEYGPKAMYAIYPVVDKVIPSMEVSGIVGDTKHGSGYHRSRNGLRRAGKTGDYSIQLPADKRGDGNACTAIDLKFSAKDMIIVTRRLMVACQKNDPRIAAVREFFGTLNGSKVTGWNRAVTGRPIGYVTADSSHLWHVHISIFREDGTDADEMQKIAQVIIGAPLKATTTPPVVTPPVVTPPKPPTPPKAPKTLEAQVLNLNCQWPQFGSVRAAVNKGTVRPWSDRDDDLASRAKKSEASIIIAQELGQVEARAFFAKRSEEWEYQRFGLNCVGWGPEWEQEGKTQEITLSPFGQPPRGIVLVKLRHKNGVYVWVAGTHLAASASNLSPANAVKARTAQAKEIASKKGLADYAQIILGADLNSRDSDNTADSPRSILRKDGWKTDTDQVTVKGLANDPKRGIDAILTNARTAVTACEIVPLGTGSDHEGRLATILIKENA